MSEAIDEASAARYRPAFAGITPWAGEVAAGRRVNFLGVIDPLEPEEVDRPQPPGGQHVQTRLPPLSDGEGFFEYYSTLCAVREARERFTAVSLGAHYGGPLVSAAFALQAVNPLPYRLIAVEGDPNMCAMLRRHFRENGIDAAAHSVLNVVVSDSNKPAVFTTAKARTGANVMLHARAQRENLFEMIRDAGIAEQVLHNVLTEFSTRLQTPLRGAEHVQGELELVSALTVTDILSPLDVVDYLEIDIQSAELHALPPAMQAICDKVRWVHLGTHGQGTHDIMADLFAQTGWDIHANLAPESEFQTPDGPFRTQDGVLSLRNRRFATAG